MDRAVDEDPVETGEWRDALGSVLAFEGPERARFLLDELMRRGAPQGRAGALLGHHAVSEHHPARPGAAAPGRPARSSTRSARYIRWNALAIVLRANKESSELGGHIASFQSVGPALRHRLHALLARARPRSMAATWSTSRATARPGIYARSLPRGPADRGAAAQLPPGGRRRGPSAPTRIPG